MFTYERRITWIFRKSSKLEKIKKAIEAVPWATRMIGHEIDQLKPLGIKIAVITNASLIWQDMWGVNLMKADWVTLKIDSTREVIWRNINRHYGALQLALILDGMLEFAKAAIRSLIGRNPLVKAEYKGRKFYVRRLDKPCRETSPPGRGLKGVFVSVFCTVQKDKNTFKKGDQGYGRNKKNIASM